MSVRVLQEASVGEVVDELANRGYQIVPEKILVESLVESLIGIIKKYHDKDLSDSELREDLRSDIKKIMYE